MIAFDKSSAKVTKLQENIRRFNLTCVQCFKFDATKAVLAISTGEVDRGLCVYIINFCSIINVDCVYYLSTLSYDSHDSIKIIIYAIEQNK